MREILFHGKRVDNGEWVVGDLIQLHNARRFIINNKFGACIDDKGNFVNTEAPFVCEVIPETVGQYTGLTDKNGTKIFKGGIGRYKQTDGAKINGNPMICIGKVVYNEKTASFAVDSKDEIGAKNYDYFPIKDFKIIGNIHNNPELLGGGEDA